MYHLKYYIFIQSILLILIFGNCSQASDLRIIKIHLLYDKEFISKGSFKSNFLCNLGYGDKSKLLNRLPRFKFSEVCKIL